MPQQSAREWMCRKGSGKMGLVTEEMVAKAIKDGKTMTASALEWNVKFQNLSKHIKKQNLGVNGTWPNKEINCKRARDALEAMGSAGIIDLNGTQSNFAAQFGITQTSVSKIAKQFDEPVISAGRTKEHYDHASLLLQQLRDGSVRRVCVSVALPPGRSVDPVPVGCSVCCLTAY
jgi:hypothetical protein